MTSTTSATLTELILDSREGSRSSCSTSVAAASSRKNAMIA